MRPTLRLLRFLLPSLLLLIAAAPAVAQPPVWVVRGPHATLVLFGSIHLLPPGLDWEPPRLKQALGEADELWFEIPFDQASSLAAFQEASRRGVQPGGHTLNEDLDPAGRLTLARAAQACGVSLDQLNHLRPWYADLLLSVASIRLDGAESEGGVEQTLSAANPTISRRAFEGINEQIGFFADAPMTDQIASLKETMKEIDEGPGEYQKLVKAWMAGDTEAIRREAIEPLKTEAPGVYASLVVARNRRWVRQINQRLQGRGEAVMVVGVGHLIGPDSVPALLRREGVRVEGP
jgi:uncharacterized protein YbaP (TraB family)